MALDVCPTRVCRPWRRHVAVLPVVVTTQRPGPFEAPGVSGRDRVGLGFVVLYALAFMASCLMLIAPLLATPALPGPATIAYAQTFTVVLVGWCVASSRR